MTNDTYYLKLNRERIQQELENIEDEVLIYDIYKYVQNMRRRVKADDEL